MGRALRVVHVNDHLEGGGAELVARTLVDEQRALGLDSVLFAARRRAAPSGWSLERLANPAAARQLGQLLEAHRPDVVHLHNCYHAISPLGERQALRYVAQERRRGRPVQLVVSGHDYAMACPSPSGQRFPAGHDGPQDVPFDELPPSAAALLLGRWDRHGAVASAARVSQFVLHRALADVLRRCDLVICGSDLSAQAYQRYGAPTVTVPLFADVRATAPAPPATSPGGVVRALYLGRLDDLKGLDRLLTGWPAEPGFHLAVAGRGPAEDRCRAIVADRGLTNVTFLGELDRDGVTATLAGTDVLVSPTRWRETAGLVVLEAQALGIPAIVPSGTALAEAVRDWDSGIAVDDFAPAALRRALDQVPSLPRGAGAVRRPASPADYAAAVVALYEDLHGRPGAGPRRRPTDPAG